MLTHPTSYQDFMLQKYLSAQNLQRTLFLWRFRNNKIIFTNGCFDLLHDGHLTLLAQAKDLGGKLIVGVNSDASVKRLKGDSRPIKSETSRILQLAALQAVDGVILFKDDTPLNLINEIKPDILVKGGDYKIETIIGAKEVLAYGGKVEVINLIDGFSTTKLIQKAM